MKFLENWFFRKQSSGKMSSLAGSYMRTKPEDLMNLTEEAAAKIAADIRKLAGSVVSQDETSKETDANE